MILNVGGRAVQVHALIHLSIYPCTLVLVTCLLHACALFPTCCDYIGNIPPGS